MAEQNKNQVSKWERYKNKYNPDFCIFRLITENTEWKPSKIINSFEILKWYEECGKCNNFIDGKFEERGEV
ncbi:MAG: hypothetical protein DRI36_00770 [Caldiserica bacterium]|nr:MAG: hypothetical protein DRI36_00770 [Caldisericota bacterium]